MSEQDAKQDQSGRQSNKPVETLRDGALKVSIFRNASERGDSYALSPARIYTDEETGKVHEAHSLQGSEPLRMANLLNQGYNRVTELREQMKKDRASSKDRDNGRER